MSSFFGQGSLAAPWTAYTPTVSSGSGTITTGTATGFYQLVGKTCFVRMAYTITTNGTGATTLRLTLPFAVKTTTILSGSDFATTAKEIKGSATGSTLNITYYDSTYPAYDGAVGTILGVYEIL